MKNTSNQKGFINVFTTIVVVLVVVILGYFVFNKKSEAPNTENQDTNSEINQNKLVYIATYYSSGDPSRIFQEYKIYQVNADGRNQKELAITDGLNFGSFGGSIFYLRDNKILANKNGQIEVILDLQSYAGDKDPLRFLISPSGEELILSINSNDLAKNRKASIYKYNLSAKNTPTLIKETKLSPSWTLIPNLLDAAGQIHMYYSGAVDCGGNVQVINKEGESISVKKIIDAPHDEKNQYFLVAEEIPSSFIFDPGMCSDGKGLSKIGVYDVKEKSFNVLEEDVNKNFIPVSISEEAKSVIYRIQDISSYKNGYSAGGSIKDMGYAFVNLKTKEKKLFQNLSDLLSFLSSDLSDNTLLESEGALYWNGVKVLESNDGHEIYFLGHF